MNWKLILQLSMFALVMGIATVFVIPSKLEPIFWLAIFIFCAYKIAHDCATRRFLHGVLLGLVNCIWVTGAHVLFFAQYLAHHAGESHALSAGIPNHPRMTMAIGGPVVGLISGIVIGLFALIAGKFIKTGGEPKVMSQTA